MNLEEQFIKETGLSSTIPNYINSDGYYSQDYVEWLENKLVLPHIIPQFSVSLVYQDQNTNMLRTLVLESKSKYEALGKAIEYFEKETKGLALVLKAVTDLSKC
jgi:hypothetical protein